MARIIPPENDHLDTHPSDGVLNRNDVTRRSRITGRSPAAVVQHEPLVRGLDWAPVLTSVFIGVAISAMLVIFGVAAGLVAGDESTSSQDVGGILGAVGVWMVIAVLIGTFVGTFLGGRLSRVNDRASVMAHALTSWGLAILVSIALVALVSIGFASSTTTAAVTARTAGVTTTDANNNAEGTTADRAATTKNQSNADKDKAVTTGDEAVNAAGDALGGAGWALGLGMLLALGAAIGGWWLGARTALTGVERRGLVEDHDVASDRTDRNAVV